MDLGRLILLGVSLFLLLDAVLYTFLGYGSMSGLFVSLYVVNEIISRLRSSD